MKASKMNATNILRGNERNEAIRKGKTHFTKKIVDRIPTWYIAYMSNQNVGLDWTGNSIPISETRRESRFIIQI